VHDLAVLDTRELVPSPDRTGQVTPSGAKVLLGVRHAVDVDGRTALCRRDRHDTSRVLRWDATVTAPLCVACLRVVGNLRHRGDEPAPA